MLMSQLRSLGPSLQRRISEGAAVATVGFGMGQAIRLAGNLIMARFLAPEAFGLMAVAFSIQMWLAMLTDFGINTSVIRSKSSEDPSFLQTAWTLQVCRDLLIAGLFGMVGFAVLALQANGGVKAGTIYADPLLPPVMWAICAATVISAFRSIRLPMAQRNIALRRLVAMEISAQLFAIIVMVTAAVAGAGVFALVLGMIASAVFTTIASYVMFEGAASRFGFVRKHFNELFHFGKWLLAASFFGFLINRGDKLLFGYLLSSNAFSIYAIAGIWIAAIETLVATVLQKVAYPALSEISRENPEKLRASYEMFRRAAEGGCLFVFACVFFLSDFAFDLLYPESFAGVAEYMRLLSPMILLLPYRLLFLITLVDGDSRKFTLLTLASGAGFLVITPLAFAVFGAKIAILTVALLPIFSLPIAWRFAARRFSLNAVNEAAPLAAALLVAAYLAFAT